MSVMDKIISDHASLAVIKDSQKVRCALTSHEMPCKVEVVVSYVNGKKYKNARDKQSCSLLEKYKDHLESSFKKNRSGQLFCKITWRHLNNNPKHIERHVNGKRFKKALKHFEECKENGIEFKPLSGLYGMKRARDDDKENKKYSTTQEDCGDEHSSDSEDDMLDLYPDIDNKSESDSETNDSDFEFEDLESAARQPNDTTEKQSNGNKQVLHSDATKQVFKRKQQKQKGPRQKQPKPEHAAQVKYTNIVKPTKSSTLKDKKLKKAKQN